MKINHNKHFRISIIVFIAYFGFLCFAILLDKTLSKEIEMENNVDVVEELLSILNFAAQLSFCIGYMLLLSAIYARLIAVNECLKQQMLVQHQSHQMDLEVIKKVTIIYEKLCDITELYNVCFAFNIMIYFVQFTFFVIFNLFAIYHYLTSSESHYHELIFNFISFGWVLYYAWSPIWILIYSSWIKTQGNETGALFHKLMNVKNDIKLMNTFHITTMQLNHRQLNISCGLFEVDWQYLFGFIGTVFSYLIIMIQFDTA